MLKAAPHCRAIKQWLAIKRRRLVIRTGQEETILLRNVVKMLRLSDRPCFVSAIPDQPSADESSLDTISRYNIG